MISQFQNLFRFSTRMVNIYKPPGMLRWFAMLLISCLVFPIKAQLIAPPVIQRQKIVEGGINTNSRARLTKTTTGDVAVLNGSRLSYIHAAGTLKSIAAVEGSVLINPSGPEYATVQKTFGLAPASDGGVVVLVSDAANLYVIKNDATQSRVWSTSIVSNTNSSNQEVYTELDILPASDGGYMVFSIHSVVNYLGNITATKVTSSGRVLWSRDVFSQQPANGTDVVSREFTKVTAASDGGYLITGRTFRPLTRPRSNPGTATKIDAQATITWSRNYEAIVDFNDLIANPYEPGTFLALGINDPNFGGSYNGPTYLYKMQADGSVARLGDFTLNAQSRIAADGSGEPYYVVLEGTDLNRGDFILTGFNQQNQSLWSKTLGGSEVDMPHAILATGDGYLLGGTTTSTDGDIEGKQGNTLSTWAVKLGKTVTPLVQTAPTYTCQTGAITFNVSGGNGTPISYTAPGITRASVTDNFGTVESGLRDDPRVIAITAMQNGVSVTYTFDLKAACNRARVGTEESGTGMQVRVLGNPVVGPTANLEITGVIGQRVRVELIDKQGRTLHLQTIDQAEFSEAVHVPLGRSNGLLLLQVNTDQERKTIKLLN